MKLEKTRKAKPVNGAPAFYGLFADLDGVWHVVRNESGFPISYTTESAAMKGAEFVGAAWRINERMTGAKPYAETEA